MYEEKTTKHSLHSGESDEVIQAVSSFYSPTAKKVSFTEPGVKLERQSSEFEPSNERRPTPFPSPTVSLLSLQDGLLVTQQKKAFSVLPQISMVESIKEDAEENSIQSEASSSSSASVETGVESITIEPRRISTPSNQNWIHLGVSRSRILNIAEEVVNDDLYNIMTDMEHIGIESQIDGPKTLSSGTLICQSEFILLANELVEMVLGKLQSAVLAKISEREEAEVAPSDKTFTGLAYKTEPLDDIVDVIIKTVLTKLDSFVDLKCASPAVTELSEVNRFKESKLLYVIPTKKVHEIVSEVQLSESDVHLSAKELVCYILRVVKSELDKVAIEGLVFKTEVSQGQESFVTGKIIDTILEELHTESPKDVPIKAEPEVSCSSVFLEEPLTDQEKVLFESQDFFTKGSFLEKLLNQHHVKTVTGRTVNGSLGTEQDNKIYDKWPKIIASRIALSKSEVSDLALNMIGTVLEKLLSETNAASSDLIRIQTSTDKKLYEFPACNIYSRAQLSLSDLAAEEIIESVLQKLECFASMKLEVFFESVPNEMQISPNIKRSLLSVTAIPYDAAPFGPFFKCGKESDMLKAEIQETVSKIQHSRSSVSLHARDIVSFILRSLKTEFDGEAMQSSLSDIIAGDIVDVVLKVIQCENLEDIVTEVKTQNSTFSGNLFTKKEKQEKEYIEDDLERITISKGAASDLEQFCCLALDEIQSVDAPEDDTIPHEVAETAKTQVKLMGKKFSTTLISKSEGSFFASNIVKVVLQKLQSVIEPSVKNQDSANEPPTSAIQSKTQLFPNLVEMATEGIINEVLCKLESFIAKRESLSQHTGTLPSMESIPLKLLEQQLCIVTAEKIQTKISKAQLSQSEIYMCAKDIISTILAAVKSELEREALWKVESGVKFSPSEKNCVCEIADIFQRTLCSERLLPETMFDFYKKEFPSKFVSSEHTYGVVHENLLEKFLRKKQNTVKTRVKEKMQIRTVSSGTLVSMSNVTLNVNDMVESVLERLHSVTTIELKLKDIHTDSPVYETQSRVNSAAGEIVETVLAKFKSFVTLRKSFSAADISGKERLLEDIPIATEQEIIQVTPFSTYSSELHSLPSEAELPCALFQKIILSETLTAQETKEKVLQNQLSKSEVSSCALRVISTILRAIKNDISNEAVRKVVSGAKSSMTQEIFIANEIVDGILQKVCKEGFTDITSKIKLVPSEKMVTFQQEQALLQKPALEPVTLNSAVKRETITHVVDQFPPVNVPGMVIYSQSEPEKVPSSRISSKIRHDLAPYVEPQSKTENILEQLAAEQRCKRSSVLHTKCSKEELGFPEKELAFQRHFIPKGSFLEKLFQKKGRKEAKVTGNVKEVEIVNILPQTTYLVQEQLKDVKQSTKGFEVQEIASETAIFPSKLNIAAKTIVSTILFKYGLMGAEETNDTDKVAKVIDTAAAVFPKVSGTVFKEPTLTQVRSSEATEVITPPTFPVDLISNESLPFKSDYKLKFPEKKAESFEDSPSASLETLLHTVSRDSLVTENGVTKKITSDQWEKAGWKASEVDLLANDITTSVVEKLKIIKSTDSLQEKVKDTVDPSAGKCFTYPGKNSWKSEDELLTSNSCGPIQSKASDSVISLLSNELTNSVLFKLQKSISDMELAANAVPPLEKVVCRNSFRCVQKPEISKVELLKDVQNKQDLIISLVTHDITQEEEGEETGMEVVIGEQAALDRIEDEIKFLTKVTEQTIATSREKREDIIALDVNENFSSKILYDLDVEKKRYMDTRLQRKQSSTASFDTKTTSPRGSLENISPNTADDLEIKPRDRKSEKCKQKSVSFHDDKESKHDFISVRKVDSSKTKIKLSSALKNQTSLQTDEEFLPDGKKIYMKESKLPAGGQFDHFNQQLLKGISSVVLTPDNLADSEDAFLSNNLVHGVLQTELDPMQFTEQSLPQETEELTSFYPPQNVKEQGSKEVTLEHDKFFQTTGYIGNLYEPYDEVRSFTSRPQKRNTPFQVHFREIATQFPSLEQADCRYETQDQTVVYAEEMLPSTHSAAAEGSSETRKTPEKSVLSKVSNTLSKVFSHRFTIPGSAKNEPQNK
nr:PREDICTED: fibrous sheath-interacting protein 2 isoform X2 [Latimeria chalumnae]|eukprot:XP_014351835.1 PREDICTED: fibrous sheath-interacting protein 2 isoform X2 [Latimeria chalumnae]